MKILLVITGLGVGGAETQVVSLADKLSEKGHHVQLAYIISPALVLPKRKDVKVVYLGGNKSVCGSLKALVNLIKMLRKNSFDVVHSHMFHANIFTRLVKIFAPVFKLINTAHSNNEGGWLRMLIYRITNPLCDLFTAVSRDAACTLESKGAAPKNSIYPVLNGIDCNRFSFCAESRMRLREGLDSITVFLAVGRLVKAKGYPYLLNAFAQIVEKNNNVVLWIVGDGPLRSSLELMIVELKLENHVNFFGVREDIPAILSAADIFVLASEWEGFGLVVAEAMAVERVVVATDCGGVREVLGVKNGYLVPTKSVDDLSQAMQNALTLDDNKRSISGKQSRKRIEQKYSLDATVKLWESFYRSNEQERN